jgi:hypothetical protein
MEEYSASGIGREENEQKKRKFCYPDRDHIELFLIPCPFNQLVENDAEKHDHKADLKDHAHEVRRSVETFEKNIFGKSNSAY